MINVEAHAVHCRMVNSIILWWMNYLVKGTIPLRLKHSNLFFFCFGCRSKIREGEITSLLFVKLEKTYIWREESRGRFQASYDIISSNVGIVHAAAASAAKLVVLGLRGIQLTQPRPRQQCLCIMGTSEERASNSAKPVDNESDSSKYCTGTSVRVGRVDYFTLCCCCTT